MKRFLVLLMAVSTGKSGKLAGKHQNFLDMTKARESVGERGEL